jgi:hypothetical protein
MQRRQFALGHPEKIGAFADGGVTSMALSFSET